MPSFSHCFRWLLLLSVFLAAEEAVQPKKEYYTKKAPKGAVSIDGEINEDIWNSVPWAGGDFIVRSPNEGEAPVANTRFKVLYDESYIYFAIRAYDAEPDKIVRRVARRDRFEGDWVEVNIDSYFDKRTAFSFTITAAGVKGDEFISNDGDNWDASWDPIWYVDTHLDDQGWTAEMKIPFSQIRFNSSDDQIWGLQVNRLNYRNNERSHWIFVPQSSKGWVHEFGELRGISGIEPSRRVEVLPYVVAKNERFPTEAGNPFSDGSDFGGNLGIDAKIGLTSDITMDLTLNPDFGQVEADPSEVNLTAFETFFEEKRPFFIEGRNILDYAVTEAAWGGNYSSDNLFYSRRIGRRPQRFPDVPDGGFVDQPRNSSILGAAKITGKTASGWSLGIMESITAQEKAVIEGDGQRFKEVVEPATNYLLGRLQKDFNGGQRTLGMIATATNRSKESLLADRLHNAAYTGGVDFLQNMNDRVYYLSGNLIGSYVEGDARAIANTQMSSTHYFQRPDADHLDYDSTRTSLSGHGGTLKFGKRGDFKYQGGVTWRSPGLELNDMGFLRRADEVNQWAWMNIRKPNWGGMDSFNWNWNTQSSWNFNGDRLNSVVNTNGNITFRNKWYTGTSMTRELGQFSVSTLRGGPGLKLPGYLSWNMWMGTDSRKTYRLESGFWQNWVDDNAGRSWEVWLWANMRPGNAFSLSLNPFYNVRNTKLQYVSGIDVADDKAYLFGTLDQKTTGMTMRINYSANPVLSLEYYFMPFFSTGQYQDFKRITNPRADAFADRYRAFSGSQVQYDGDEEVYRVDENGDGGEDYQFDNPDFNFRDFNSNLVVRWEYSPGSTFFLVWTHNRQNSLRDGAFDLGNDLDRLWRARGNNVFLIKVTRWFSI